MGGSVSSIASSGLGFMTGGIAGDKSSSPFAMVGGMAGGAAGGMMQGMAEGISNGVNALGLNVTPADLSNLQAAYVSSGGNLAQFNQSFQQLQAQSNAQLAQTQQALGQANQSLGQANQSLGQASNVTNVLQGSALGLAGQMAEGSAPAQTIAKAQLQQGTDQAIQSQMAMANSGNLSQQISGQRGAMVNAANLQQQSANQSAQNLAASQIAGMQQYGTQATQATTAAQNIASQRAGLSSQQAGLASQQVGIYGTQLGQQANMASAANTAQGNTITAATNAASIQEQANEATAKYKAMAAGGLAGAMGSVGAGAATASDKNLKKDIKSDKKMVEAFLDGVEAKSFEYKNPTGEKGMTEGEHMGVMAQDVEAAPGGKSMVIDMPEGKGIDVPSAVGMLMAAASNTHDRLKDIEEFFKTRKDRG